MLDDAWISENDRMRWYVAVHIGIRRNQYIVSDRDITNNCTVYSDPHAIADYRCAFAPASIFLSDRNAFMYIAIPSNNCCLINRYTIRMSDI